MKSFDPIDIVFMLLIGFYLIILLTMIFLFVLLSRDYDDEGNRVKEDQKISKYNNYANSFLDKLKATYLNFKKYITDNFTKEKMNNEIKPIPKKEEIKATLVEKKSKKTKPKEIVTPKKELKSIDELLETDNSKEETEKEEIKDVEIKPTVNKSNQVKKQQSKKSSTKKNTNKKSATIKS